jgi:hypothetical protein
MKYKTTKEECERNIKGVCEGCGGKLSALETVDNSGDPTFWQGCEHCSSFRRGIEEKYFKVARILVEENIILPYYHMDKNDYNESEESLQFFYDCQTASLSHIIKKIHHLLSE